MSKVEAPVELYKKDSALLAELIKADIEQHDGAYHSKQYNSNTGVIIDTIVYSPDYRKLVFFIINRIENKNTFPDNISKEEIEAIEQHTDLSYDGYSYDATTYVGMRDVNNLRIEFLGISVGNFKRKDINKLQLRQRQIFFEEYAAVGEPGYEYNINDSRFWANAVFWNKISEKEKKRQAFKVFKKNHPEDVYEPK